MNNRRQHRLGRAFVATQLRRKISIMQFRLPILVITLVVLFPACLMAADSSESCFQRLHDHQHPFDVYFGVAKDRHTYIQRTDAAFGLSEEAEILLNHVPEELRVISLCDRNHVASWIPRNRGRITARIFDDGLKAIAPDFEVADNDNFQWEHWLTPLANGNFAMAYKVHAKKGRKIIGIKIRARIFDGSGKSLGPAFSISSSRGFHNRPKIYGLPGSGFVALWIPRDPAAVYLRIFDDAGHPKTGEVLVMADAQAFREFYDPCSAEPYGYITDGGVINVFMRCRGRGVEERSRFFAARSYNEGGVPLTDLLHGKEMEELPGHTVIIEQLVRDFASKLDFVLRAFNGKDMLFGKSLCTPTTSYREAVIMKGLTQDHEMREFITRYCQNSLKTCGPARFIDPYHKQCAEVE